MHLSSLNIVQHPVILKAGQSRLRVHLDTAVWLIAPTLPDDLHYIIGQFAIAGLKILLITLLTNLLRRALWPHVFCYLLPSLAMVSCSNAFFLAVAMFSCSHS